MKLWMDFGFGKKFKTPRSIVENLYWKEYILKYFKNTIYI